MNVADQIARLQTMPTAELAAEFERVYGRRPRYRSVPWMRKRIAFQLQVMAYGGLPSLARAPLNALIAQIALPPAVAAEITPNAPSPQRGPRPGTVLQREWRGKQIRVLVTADGFEWDGQRFGSLSAVAHAITGAHWSGALFFNLRGRSSKS